MRSFFLILCALFLLACSQKEKDLIEAIKRGDAESAIDLINKGVDVNYSDKIGRTPLHYISKNGQRDAYDLLTQPEDQPTENFRFSEFDVNKALVICELLIEKKAEIDVLDNYNKTPLSLAARSAEFEICKFLIDKGANVNSVGLPLNWAAYSGSLEVFKLMIENGADLHGYNKLGNVLNYACMNPKVNLDIIKILLQKNIDLEHRDSWGRTALQFTINRKDFGLAKMLLENGANPNSVTYEKVGNRYKSIGSVYITEDDCQKVMNFLKDYRVGSYVE